MVSIHQRHLQVWDPSQDSAVGAEGDVQGGDVGRDPFQTKAHPVQRAWTLYIRAQVTQRATQAAGLVEEDEVRIRAHRALRRDRDNGHVDRVDPHESRPRGQDIEVPTSLNVGG